MRDVPEYQHIDLVRAAVVKVWRGNTRAEILAGAAELLDLTHSATKVRTANNKVTVTVAYDSSFLECGFQPSPGDYIGVIVDGIWRALMIIDNIGDFLATRGNSTFTITGRTRDGTGGWRTKNSNSALYPLGSNYSVMMEEICGGLMHLEDDEYVFPATSYTVPHSNLQFAAMTPWTMLEELVFACRLEIYVDVLNVIRTFSKELLRSSDIEVPNERVVEFKAARQVITLGSVRLDWLDFRLHKYYQSDQILAQRTLTMGYFKKRLKEPVYFSVDKTQRADNTYMKIVDSVNTFSLLRVCDEEYIVVNEFKGIIELRSRYWTPGLIAVIIGTLVAYSREPDIAPSGGGPTDPIGRVKTIGLLAGILVIMAAIGTGVYEVWGTPYEFAHGRNTTVARAENLPSHSLQESRLETSLVVSNEHAADLATMELSYKHAQSYMMSVKLLDDPRIEVGDILQFEDGSRMLVSGFNNDFSRGADAVISVDGFLI